MHVADIVKLAGHKKN